MKKGYFLTYMYFHLFSHQGKDTKIPPEHTSLTYTYFAHPIYIFALSILQNYDFFPLDFFHTYIAFHQGLELSFVYGALICSLTALDLVLRTHDYNLTPSALVATVSKIKWGVFDQD